MDFKKFEEAIYKDEQFLMFLPLLRKEYWEKASPTKRLQIFKEIERVVNGMDEKFPLDVFLDGQESFENESVIFYENMVLMCKEVLKSKTNPYRLISNYIFELALANNLELAGDSEFVKTDLGKKFSDNIEYSCFNDWNNYFPRTNSNYYLQPVVRESMKQAIMFTYNLLKYMYKNYGMDNYIGDQLSTIMISSFEDEKMDKMTEENYKIMKKRVQSLDNEKKQLDGFVDYLKDIDFDTLSDDEFYSLFNKRLVNALNDDTRFFLYVQFAKRVLKKCENVEEIANSIGIGDVESEYGDTVKALIMDDLALEMGSPEKEFENIAIFAFNKKIRLGLVDEIENEGFKKEAQECLEIIDQIKDENGKFYCSYLADAFAYFECRSMLFDYYNNKIRESMKRCNKFVKGEPLINGGDFCKYRAFLKYGYNKSYEEVRKEQFDDLKQKLLEKKGGIK